MSDITNIAISTAEHHDMTIAEEMAAALIEAGAKEVTLAEKLAAAFEFTPVEGKAQIVCKERNGSRILIVQKSTPLDLYRITKMLGNVGQETLQMALNAASVVSINDDAVPPPGTERQIMAIIGRLRFEDFPVISAAQEMLSPKADMDAVKNS